MLSVWTIKIPRHAAYEVTILLEGKGPAVHPPHFVYAFVEPILDQLVIVGEAPYGPLRSRRFGPRLQNPHYEV